MDAAKAEEVQKVAVASLRRDEEVREWEAAAQRAEEMRAAEEAPVTLAMAEALPLPPQRDDLSLDVPPMLTRQYAVGIDPELYNAPPFGLSPFGGFVRQGAGQPPVVSNVDAMYSHSLPRWVRLISEIRSHFGPHTRAPYAYRAIDSAAIKTIVAEMREFTNPCPGLYPPPRHTIINLLDLFADSENYSSDELRHAALTHIISLLEKEREA